MRIPLAHCPFNYRGLACSVIAQRVATDVAMSDMTEEEAKAYIDNKFDDLWRDAAPIINEIFNTSEWCAGSC